MKKVKVLTLLIIAAVLILNWHAGILILSFACAYSYFGRKFSTATINSHALLFVVTLFTYTATLGLLILICSAIASITMLTVLMISFVLFMLLLIYEVRISKQVFPTRKLLQTGDIVSILVSLIAFCALTALPLANLTAQKQHSNTLALITGNVDSAAHLAIFNDYLGFGKTQTWNQDTPSRAISDGFYPSSWHGANATVVQALRPSLSPGTTSAALFGLLNAFWISVLVFIMSRYAFTTYDAIDTKQRRASVYLAIPLLTLVAFYFFFVHLLSFGFFSYTPQMIATILLAYCLHQMLRYGVGVKSGLGLAVLYCAVSLASWVLLAPVMLGATFLTVLATLYNRPLTKKSIASELVSNWSLFALSALSAVAQLWLMLGSSASAGTGIRSGLLLDGGTPIYSTFIYILLFAGLGSAIFYAQRARRELLEFYKPVLIISIVTILFAGVIFVYQAYYTGTNHYYYYKCVWLLPTLLTPIGIAMIAVCIDSIRERLFAVLAAFTIPILLIQFLPSDTSMLTFMRGSRTVSATVNTSVWKEMHRNTYPSKRVTMYFAYSGTNETSVISTLLVAANRPYNACFQNLNEKIVYEGNDKALTDIVSGPPPSVCRDKHVVLVVDPTYRDVVNSGAHSKDYTVHYLHE